MDFEVLVLIVPPCFNPDPGFESELQMGTVVVRLNGLSQWTSYAMLILSVDEIYSAFNLSPDEFRAKYGFEKPAKTAALCTHCKMGKRATDAADKLFLLGYENVAVYR